MCRPEAGGPRNQRSSLHLSLGATSNLSWDDTSGGEGHVFRAVIRGREYAVKVFKFYIVEKYRPHREWEAKRELSVDTLTYFCDPFFNECRAYARIQELQKEGKLKYEIVSPCHGFLFLNPRDEEILYRRNINFWQHWMDPDYQRQTPGGIRLRAIVKELASPDHGVTKQNIRQIYKGSKELNRHGVFVWDIKLDNFLDGRFIDLVLCRIILGKAELEGPTSIARKQERLANQLPPGQLSGDKPQCVRCATKGLACEYDGELAGVTLGDLRKKYRELTSENEVLRMLLSYIASRPEVEAQYILGRLRRTTSPQHMVELIMSGDLVLQQHLSSVVGNECEELRNVENAALQESAVRVSSRPWTNLVGDGILSDLISGFMAYDQPFLFSFIDKARFLEDMRAGDPNKAKYCSPFLVNAICSLRCHTSRYAKKYSRIKRIDLREDFLNHAKHLLALESGKLSLPTVQGLVIMYMCCAGMGRDRAGMMFRFLAYDMLQRLHLIRVQRDVGGQDAADEEAHQRSQAASRTSWGLYCFESIISFAYSQPSLVPRPTCPRTFLGNRTSRSPDGEFDSSWILDAMCDLSIIYNEAMSHNNSGNCKLGSEVDLTRRSEYLARVRDWRVSLAEPLQLPHNPSMEVYLLRSFEDQVIISIVQILDEDTVMPMTDLLVRDIKVSCCMRSIEGLEYFMEHLDAGSYSCYVVFPLYTAAITLLSLHHHPTARELFTRTCHHLSLRSGDFPFTAYLLQAIKSLAEVSKTELPLESRQYFEALDFKPEDLRDVPLTFVIPDHEDVQKELRNDQKSDSVGLQLGALIRRWSWMTS
ncbi:Nitrogen assimilation transcription factor nirA 5 [Paramyrothecium foliicola]|nr:Nitrogen assimilation transcription factor nirA 5 [Paramyrothecium foliicola]